MNTINNYPVMSQSQLAKAPFNQEEPKPIDVEVVVSNTLSKQLSVTTCDYTQFVEDEVEYDEEGHPQHTKDTYYEYDDCNFVNDYKEEHLTLPQILEKSISYLLEYKDEAEALYNKENQESTNKNKLKKTIIDLEWLIDEASDWSEDELEVTN